MASVERSYQKYAWILIAVSGVFFIFDGLVFLAGINPDPSLFQSLIGQSLSSFQASHPTQAGAMQYLFHGFGLLALGLGIFTIAISYVPYRRGERWAWYIAWYLPVFMLIAAIANYTFGGEAWSAGLIFVIVTLAGLTLPFRKFFPRK
jgi:hypothetical protein